MPPSHRDVDHPRGRPRPDVLQRCRRVGVIVRPLRAALTPAVVDAALACEPARRPYHGKPGPTLRRRRPRSGRSAAPRSRTGYRSRSAPSSRPGRSDEHPPGGSTAQNPRASLMRGVSRSSCHSDGTRLARSVSRVMLPLSTSRCSPSGAAIECGPCHRSRRTHAATRRARAGRAVLIRHAVEAVLAVHPSVDDGASAPRNQSSPCAPLSAAGIRSNADLADLARRLDPE